MFHLESQRGQFEVIGCHDRLLTGLKQTHAGLKLYIGQSDYSDLFTLLLPNVLQMNMENFLAGNLVDGIYFYTAQNYPEEDLAFACTVEGVVPDANALASVRAEMRCGLTLVPTYGCYLCAVSTGAVSDIVLRGSGHER